MTQSSIMVVDDNEDVRTLMAARLQRRDFQVQLAENGRQALQLLNKNPVDLILLDIMMPEMNGYEVLQKLKNHPELSTIPVVVMSALHDTSSVVKCVELGAEDYLFKPVNRALLWARIHASLEKKALHDQEKAFLKELSVLQQIDRELNANLNLAEAARITLGWAVRQADAPAGLIGMVVKEGLQVKATENMVEMAEAQIPLATLPVEEVVANGRPHQFPLVPGEGFLPASRHHTLAPILREHTLHGLLILETQKPLDQSTLSFLSRLSDHAAIALINAQLYEEVRAANQLKSRFISLISHELKTPISVIDAYTQYVADSSGGAVSPEQSSYLNTIRASMQRMKGLVSDLDDISNPESGHLRLECEPVLLGEVVSEVINTLERQILEKEQVITVLLEPDLPPLWADRSHLLQILTNLVGNACQYTPCGKRVTISARLVEEASARPLVRVAVQDKGIGIDTSEQERIFERFFRSDDEQVQNVAGRGTGLTVAKTLIEMHQGEIWLESEPGEGSTFYFTIPVAQTTPVSP